MTWFDDEWVNDNWNDQLVNLQEFKNMQINTYMLIWYDILCAKQVTNNIGYIQNKHQYCYNIFFSNNKSFHLMHSWNWGLWSRLVILIEHDMT